MCIQNLDVNKHSAKNVTPPVQVKFEPELNVYSNRRCCAMMGDNSRGGGGLAVSIHTESLRLTRGGITTERKKSVIDGELCHCALLRADQLHGTTKLRTAGCSRIVPLT